MGPVSAQRRGRARPLADRHRVPAGRAPPTRNRRGAREGQPRHPPLRIVASRQGGSRSRGVVLCTQDRGSLRGCLGKVWASSDKTLRETLARCVTYYAAHRRRRSSSGGASASSTSPRATTPSISPAQAPMAASGSLGRRPQGVRLLARGSRHSGRAAIGRAQRSLRSATSASFRSRLVRALFLPRPPGPLQLRHIMPSTLDETPHGPRSRS